MVPLAKLLQGSRHHQGLGKHKRKSKNHNTKMYLGGASRSDNASFLQAKDKGNLNIKIRMQRDILVKRLSVVLTGGKVAASSDKDSGDTSD